MGGRGGGRGVAFTLIELLVALALVSIMLTMMATIFFRAGRTVGMARASVEIHQNARAAFDMMLRDLASAQICNYADRTGYFALSRDTASAERATMLTFTTLATQEGATPLAPGVTPQVALVRYCLESSGKPIRFANDPAPCPVYYLVKKVRFPSLTDTNVDMDQFDNAALPERDAYQKLDPPAEPVTSDVLALGVLDMQVRALYAPVNGEALTYYGVVPPAAPPAVVQPTINRPRWLELALPGGWAAPPPPAPTPDAASFVIERRAVGEAVRMPALVEVTLVMTDRFGTRTFTLTERFHVPAAAWMR